MCDMDCGADGGFDLGTDCDISEGTDVSSDIDVIDESSSFESLEDVNDSFEEYEEDADSFSDTETECFEEVTALEECCDLIEEADECEEETMVDLTFLEDVEPELTFTHEELRELSTEHSDEPEFESRMEELIESGRVAVVETEEYEESEENNDDAKALTRDITSEVIESRERDTEEVLDNYRENLTERGVDDKQIEMFVEQEREKIYAEYDSLDKGDTSSNIYYAPLDWDAVAESLRANVPLEQGDVDEKVSDKEIGENTEENSDVFEDDQDKSFLLETNIDTQEESPNRFITYYPEEMDDTELPTEYMIEMPEMIADEETQELTEAVADDEELVDEIVEEMVKDQEIEEKLSESDDINSATGEVEVQEELYENEQEISTELSETTVNYEEIYEEIANEALQQGYKDIDIEANAEVLEQSLERFEEDTWENLEIYEQREAINELSDYIKDIIGFENPPTIEYYHSTREGEYGGYDPATNTLHINEYMLYNSKEAADTVAHELWHAHQQECALQPKNPRDYQYQYNFDNYISPEYGFEQYQNQLVEAEARSFAAQFRDRIGNDKERTR